MAGGRIPFGTIGPDLVPSIAAPPLVSMDAAAANSGAPALQGVAKGLDAVHEFGQRLVEARDSVNVSNAIVDANAQLDDYREQLQRDPDVAGREAKFNAKMAEVRQAKADQLGRSDAVTNFTMRFNTLGRTMQNTVRQQARDEELQNFRQDLGDNLDKLATQSAFAKTDQERIALQAEGEKQLVDAVRTQRLSAVQAHTLKKAYLGRVDAALAGQLVRTNPTAAIAALGDPNKYQYLDAPTRVQLQTQAQTRAESLSIQARAELRADAAELTQDIQRGAIDGNMPAEADVQAVIKRAGPKSAIGVRVQRAWDFYGQVAADTQGKTIPQLQAAIVEAQHGSRPPDDSNYRAAKEQLQLNEQESALYQRHLGNVAGPGGVNNPDGSRSTLYQMTAESDGKFYNVPTVWDGKILPPDEAMKRARAQGLDQFPSYPTEAEAESRYQAMHGFMEKDRATATPQDLHRARVLQAALQGRIAARDKDPLAYVLKAYPTIGEQAQAIAQTEQGNDETAKAQLPDRRNAMWAAVLDAERREGVPEHKIALLTASGAADLRTQFATTEGQARVDLVDQLRQQYGDQWDRVSRQLWEGKPAPGDVQVIGAMPPEANLPKVEVAEANKLTTDQAKELLGGKTLGAIDEATRTAVAGMAPTMANAPDGPQFLATYQGQIEKLARLYMVRGESDPNAAAQKAANRLFFDHWQVIEGMGGATLRVPKVQGEPIVPAPAVRAMQSTVVAALPKLDIEVPSGLPGTTEAQRKDMLVQSVKSNGYWMTTADDKGMVLVVGHGPALPVMLKGDRGRPVPLIVPFDSINAMAGIDQAAANLKAREATNAGLDAAGSDHTLDLGSDPAPSGIAIDPGIARVLRGVGEGVKMHGVPLK